MRILLLKFRLRAHWLMQMIFLHLRTFSDFKSQRKTSLIVATGAVGVNWGEVALVPPIIYLK